MYTHVRAHMHARVYLCSGLHGHFTRAPGVCACADCSWLGGAVKGHLEVLQVLVDTLSQTATDVVGSDSGNWKEEAINALTWGRFLKDVLNARTSQGETALTLACTEV